MQNNDSWEPAFLNSDLTFWLYSALADRYTFTDLTIINYHYFNPAIIIKMIVDQSS